jgi:hypothetical protein
MWLLAVGYGQTNAGVPSSTNVQSNRLNYKTDSRNYTLNVSLGFSYTISAFLTTGSASINDGPNGSSPANGIPFPVPTLPVAASGITVTHNACSVALSWPPVVGAEYYNVYYNPITAGGFGRANIPATTAPSITILSNGLLGQFGANSNYSYIIQAFSTSAYRFFGSGVRGCNLQSADSVSPVVTMFVPTNPAASLLTFSQQLSNLTISWPALTNYPQDNEADIGTPLYTISAGSLTCNATTGITATFVISPGTNYPITLNTQYKGLWGVTPTTTSYLTTAPTITVAPLLTNTGLATIRVTATAATVGFWYLLEGTTETLMNSPAAVASNAITAYTFPIVKATIYARQVKFVTQDTGLSVTSNTNTVTTPNLVVSIPTTADAGGTRQFSITLGIASGTPIGGVVWNVTTPVGTTFLSGSTTTYPTTLTYQFTNAAWSSGLAATFTSIVLSNNGFTFPYTGANPTFTAPNLAITGVTLLNEGGAGNLVVCKILALHFDNQLVMNDNRIDQIAMDLVGRMGYDFYVRANAESIFELPKPGSKDVIGFDGLPKEIRESDFLTGSELARLANVQVIPHIGKYLPLKISIDVHSSQFEIEKRQLKNLISEFQIEKAWEVLLNLIYTK